MRNTGWMLIPIVVLTACHKTQPQKPQFYGETDADTAVVQLLTMNRQMAAQADLQLAKWVSSDFVLMEDNCWVKGLYPQQEGKPLLQMGEYVDFKADIYSLQGKLLTSHQASVQLGQADEIQAIVSVLSLMQHGMHVTLLVPWYLAFGSAGNNEVPPYENIRVELSVK